MHQITHQHDISSHQSSQSVVIVSPLEAESIIASLMQYPIEEIGSSSFLKMYGFQIEKLSLHSFALTADGQHINDYDIFVGRKKLNCF